MNSLGVSSAWVWAIYLGIVLLPLTSVAGVQVLTPPGLAHIVPPLRPPRLMMPLHLTSLPLPLQTLPCGNAPAVTSPASMYGTDV